MFHNIEQNTDEWLELRAGKVTGSAIDKVMANYGKAFGEPAKKLAVYLANERLRGCATTGDRYSNAHMEAGHTEEPIARMLYEEDRFCVVTNGGFFDNGKTGCSPDGLVNSDGMVEIKSVVPPTHYETIKRNSFDPAYKWQIVFNLRETGRAWLDYISYCEQFYEPKRLQIVRVTPDQFEEEMKMIDTRLKEFEEMVEEVMRRLAA